MNHTMQNRLIDGILCTCLTVSLAEAVFSGFVLEDGLSASPLLTFVCAAVLSALLLLFSKSRKLTAVGIGIGAAVLAAAVVYIRNGHPMTDETQNSLFLAVLILICTGVLVFLLTRTGPGTVVLFLIGILIQAGSQFLQFPAPAWGFVLFLAAAAVLFLYRRGIAGMRRKAVGSFHPAGFTGQAALLCLAALLISGGLYYGVVCTLDPPTQELLLITQLKSMDLLQVLGVSSVRTVLDEDLLSLEPPEEEEQGSDPGEEETDDAMNAPEEAEEEPAEETAQTTEEASMETQGYTAVSYDDSSLSPLWLLLLIPVVLAAAAAVRIALRRRWHRHTQALPAAEAVIRYYRFFLRRLKHAGIDRPPAHTLQQYVRENAAVLRTFRAGDAEFASLTEVYQQVLYGEEPPDPRQTGLFEAFYSGFYSALRREMGTPRYLLHWFAL